MRPGGLFPMNIMKTAIATRDDTSIVSAISKIQDSVLNTVFAHYPSGLSFDCVVTGLHELIASRSVRVRAVYRDAGVERLQWILQALLHARMRMHLSTLVAMALDHVADIESGIEDGTYDPDDNRDLPLKRAAVDAFDQCVPYYGARAFVGEPSMVLCVMTPCKGLTSFYQQGTEPGVIVRTVDCTRPTGEKLVFSPEWATLLARAFRDNPPPYVQVAARTESDRAGLPAAIDHDAMDPAEPTDWTTV